MKRLNTKFIRFIISGGSAAIVEYGLFLLLSALYAPILVANTVSFLAGLVVSFTLNKVWVFSSKGALKRQFISYLLLALVNIVIGNALIWLFVEYWGVHAFVAKLLVMIVIALWNYLFFSKLIFKPISDVYGSSKHYDDL
ncbi:MAG TPA: GtrA family protein [Candidatus Saccharimonadales bacterium]|nr:GtrA family protein [Candidatus Saccharimonadales bacterium]